MPTKDEEDKKLVTIQFRVTEEQREYLTRASEDEADTVSNWCRRRLLVLAGWKPPRPA